MARTPRSSPSRIGPNLVRINIDEGQATSAAGALASYAAATAIDTVDPAPVIAYSQASGTSFTLGTTTVTVTATDASGNSSAASFTVTVVDTTPPVITAPNNVVTDETGVQTPVNIGTATASDWFLVTITKDAPATFPNGVTVVTWTATDSSGNQATATQSVTVNNVAPIVGTITAPIDPLAIGATITASAGFTDPAFDDPHTAVWNWGDGSISDGAVDKSGGTATVTNTHTYSVPGIHNVTLAVYDGLAQDSSVFQFVVVYDPDGGFVTGGGTIDSPAGAYTPNPTLTGLANFGFVAKYKKGATTPSGNTEFQFHAAGLNFHSDSYDWLVVAGARAQFKGTGTLNGSGGYGFMLTAIDGMVSGGGGSDRFRIKIWNAGGVVYDNQMGASNDSDVATVLRKGSIVIHVDDKGGS